MKLFAPLALAGACLLPAGAAFAGATVTFVQPENYPDMPFTQWERDDVLKTLQEHFEKLGKTLPPGQELKVEVLDIDLAGRVTPGTRGGRELRIMKGGADWPTMRLRYTLSADGKVLSSGEDRLSDMNYLGRSNRYFEGEPLRYEKQMIDAWFQKSFVKKKAG